MSLIKYRVREVAADLGMAPKEVADIVGKYSERPRSYSQVLTDEQLNAFFDHVTQNNQIASWSRCLPPPKRPRRNRPGTPARPSGPRSLPPGRISPASLRPNPLRGSPPKPSRQKAPPLPSSRSAAGSAGWWIPPPSG